jgi:dihydrolipoamide dehydrogenase
MSNLIEVKVPDIGDFKNIPVIEVLVKPGDKVDKEDSLITLESDKATMEVPSPAAGIVKELKIKPGDKLSEGSLILMLESAAAGAPAPKAEAPAQKAQAPISLPPAAAAPAKTPATTSPTPVIRGDIHAQVVVLGSGPGGYTAAFRAADLGMQTVLIERYPVLGGVCLNVGCIPSKALLHAARVIAEAEEMGHFGLSFSKPKIELDKLREWKGSVVEKSIRGLAGLAKQRKVTVVQGTGSFTSPHMIEVKTADGVRKCHSITPSSQRVRSRRRFPDCLTTIRA